MSVRLRVVHRTGYTYPGGAHTSYNEARMTPVSSADQEVTYTRLDITPTPWTYSYVDYWGTKVTAFEVHDRHERLQLTATSTVDVQRTDHARAGVDWATLHTPELIGARGELLELTDLTDPGPDLVSYAVDLAARSARPGDFVDTALAHIRAEMTYEPGSTGVHTRAAEAWTQRRGVCQDIVHLSLGVLRTAGIPARYVSGYVMPRHDAVVGEAVMGESHAWLQWWDGEWVSFDPTAGRAPDDFSVELARGRDYRDVTPLRGIFTGVRTSSMFVEVEVTRLA